MTSPFWNMLAELGLWFIVGTVGVYVVIEIVLWIRNFFKVRL